VRMPLHTGADAHGHRLHHARNDETKLRIMTNRRSRYEAGG